MRLTSKFALLASFAAGIAGGSFSAVPSAQAVPLFFELSGSYNYSWTLDSNPVPTGTDTPNFQDVYFANVTGLPAADYLTFYSSGNDGGLDAGTYVDDTQGTRLFDFAGDQDYSGTESNPVFTPGVYAITLDYNNGGEPITGETLTISAAPLPSTWSMMLIGLAGLGFIGFRRSRQNTATAAAS